MAGVQERDVGEKIRVSVRGRMDGGGMRHKMVVEVDKTKETLELHNGGGLRIVYNGLNIRRERSNACGSIMVAEKIKGGLSKGSFFEVDEDAIGGVDGKKLMQMVKMLLERGACHQNVIQINKNKGKVMKEVVHQPLKSLGSTAEIVGHLEVFIKAKGSDNSSLRDVRRMNGNLVICFHQIELGENIGAMKAGRKV